MDVRQMRYVLAVAQTGSVRRAAQLLSVAQPTLSQQLGIVEREVGASLFERTARGMHLTPVGEVFAAQAEAVLGVFDHALEAVADAAAGDVGGFRLAVADGLSDIVRAVLGTLRGLEPDVRVRMTRMRTAEQVAQIVQGDVQAGLGYRPVPAAEGVSRLVVHRAPIRALLPRDHALATREAISLADLAEEPLVLPRTAEAARFVDQFVGRGLHPRFGPAASGHDLVPALVAAGEGYTLCVRATAQVPPGLVFRPVLEPMPPIEVVLLWRRDAGGGLPALVAAARHLGH
ncbi:LysR family transcriptional regulator [Actinoallomurus purpureus]|uniref:LysR family transcriptional regulator n=1 Tax=Actinoallomurus purpureus TaxID=478114 RepID=UPI00209236CA|nr:LysR family transcriptional regulator [Actinoallomurus purpureus]MCO6011293.1 LysR family transcriptional regulator [Actinoallomurus purpureus]